MWKFQWSRENILIAFANHVRSATHPVWKGLGFLNIENINSEVECRCPSPLIETIAEKMGFLCQFPLMCQPAVGVWSAC